MEFMETNFLIATQSFKNFFDFTTSQRIIVDLRWVEWHELAILINIELRKVLGPLWKSPNAMNNHFQILKISHRFAFTLHTFSTLKHPADSQLFLR